MQIIFLHVYYIKNLIDLLLWPPLTYNAMLKASVGFPAHW